VARRSGRRVEEDHFSYSGKYYRVEDNVLSETGGPSRGHAVRGRRIARSKELIAEKCDAYLMHGDPPGRVVRKSPICASPSEHNLPPLKFWGRRLCDCPRHGTRSAGRAAAHHGCHNPRACELPAMACRNATGATRFPGRLFSLESRLAIRPCRTPEQVAERLAQFEAAGVDLVLLQFSPQLEEMERFAETVIRRSSSLAAPA